MECAPCRVPGPGELSQPVVSSGFPHNLLTGFTQGLEWKVATGLFEKGVAGVTTLGPGYANTMEELRGKQEGTVPHPQFFWPVHTYQEIKLSLCH